ncbi:flippase [Trichlorobacter ammonificans]|uniref:Polysaccharide biosynthesis protein n=1 Tax=Trichlorobacter ammonificans TaxID=2916410 RepID=A0ABN8HL48_9BACT|nr:flippase [Trichlorobacter ammonificans]CAH2032039.1 Polysaccharide biosynthesis protein [Trichlorobacter ammonificans]
MSQPPPEPRGLPRFLPASLRNRIAPLLAAPGFSNTLWLFGDRLLRMGVGLVVGVWVARYLGPEGYGLLSFAGSYVMLFSALALFGLESLVVRELVTRPDQREAILGTTCLIRCAAGLAAYLLALPLLLLIRPGDSAALLLTALLGSSLLFQSLEVIDLWFQSKVRSRFSVCARSVAFLLSSGAKLALVLSKASLTAIAVATAAEALLTGLGLIVAYRMAGGSLRAWRWDRGQFSRLVTGAVPMLLSGVVLMIYLRVDQVMLGALADAGQVGQYAAAVRIAELWYFVPAAIVSSVFPDLVRVREQDPVLFQDKLQRLYNLLAFLGYAVALPVTLLAPWLVRLLFGPSYQPAAPLLAVLIWAGLFANITVVRNAHFIALEWGRSLLWATTAGAAANVLLNLLLIPRYGAMGAALATCLSYWIAAHGACYAVPALRPAAAMILRALLLPRWWRNHPVHGDS